MARSSASNFPQWRPLQIESEARVVSAVTNEDDERRTTSSADTFPEEIDDEFGDISYASWTTQQNRLYGSSVSDDFSERVFISHTAWFKVGIGAVICLNIFTIGLEATFNQETQWRIFFGIVETIFSVIYVAETSYRIYELGPAFFRQTWNWFDFVVNLASVFDTVMFFLGASGVGVAAIRIFRVFRILRLFRAFPFLDIVVASTVAATAKLAILFLLLLFIFSVLLTNLLGDMPDYTARSSFGDLGRSMYTVFKLMTTQDWAGTAEHVNHLRPGILFVFAILVFLGPIAITALVPAVLIEIGAIEREHKKDRDVAWKRHQSNAAKKRLLRHLFAMTDTDGNGMVSVAEMNAVLDSFETLRLLKTNNLTVEEDLRDMKLSLFQLWEDRAAMFEGEGDGDLSEAEFISGMLHIWGDMNLRMIWRAITSTRMHVMRMWRPDVDENVSVGKTLHRRYSKKRVDRTSTATLGTRSSVVTQKSKQLTKDVSVSRVRAHSGSDVGGLSEELRIVVEKQSDVVARALGNIAQEMQLLHLKVDSLQEAVRTNDLQTHPTREVRQLTSNTPENNGWDALVAGLREESSLMEAIHKRFDELLRQLERHHEDFRRDCQGEFLTLNEKLHTSLNTRLGSLQSLIVNELTQPKEKHLAPAGHISERADIVTSGTSSKQSQVIQTTRT